MKNMKVKNADKDKSPILMLYGVYDTKAGRYFPPFLNDNDQTAMRAFRSMATGDESVIAQNPEDYKLMRLGDFDPNDGQIDALDQPSHVCDAMDFFQAPRGVGAE